MFFWHLYLPLLCLNNKQIINNSFQIRKQVVCHSLRHNYVLTGTRTPPTVDTTGMCEFIFPVKNEQGPLL